MAFIDREGHVKQRMPSPSETMDGHSIISKSSARLGNEVLTFEAIKKGKVEYENVVAMSELLPSLHKWEENEWIESDSEKADGNVDETEESSWSQPEICKERLFAPSMPMKLFTHPS